MDVKKLVTQVEQNKTLLGGVIASLLGLLTFIVYYPSLRYGFLFDDLPTITEYFHVRVFDPMGQFFSNSRWISRLLNQWTYKHWQTNPFAYRIVDLGMHIAIGVMIFFVLLKAFSMLKKENILTKHSYLVATLVSGLFLLHPTQTQTATYVTQMRLEGLVVFFVFGVILAFTYAVQAKHQYTKIALYSLSTVLMMFAAGTKEIVIVAPALVMLFDWFLLAAGDWSVFKKRLVVHGILCVAMFGTMAKFGYAPTPRTISTMATTELRNNRGNTLTEAPTVKITPVRYAMSQFRVLVHYMSIFLNPTGLSFDYDIKLASSFFSAAVIFPFLLLLALLAACCFLLYQNASNHLVFGMAWFMVAMLPRASIFPTTELICDYKTFLPSFGMLFLLGIGLAHLLVWAWEKAAVFSKAEYKSATVASLFIVLGCATASRNVVWTSELTFWKDVITKAPGKSRGYNNYAVALWENGHAQAAIDNYKKALAVDGSYGEPHVNLATIYQGMGRKDEALEHYKKALDTGEVHPELYHNLGVLHMSNEHWETAELCFREAVHARPYYSRSWIQLGKVFQIQNKIEQATQCYEQALMGDRGNDPELLYLYASNMFQQGNVDKAQAAFAQLDKRYLDVSFQLGCCNYAKNHYAQAAKHFADACAFEPNNASFRYNYAMALMNSGKYHEALVAYKACESEIAQLPYLALHAAHCMYKIGDKKAAKTQLADLIKYTPIPEIKKEAQAFMKQNGLA